MSGSALSPWAIARDPEHYARELGNKLNCTNLVSQIFFFSVMILNDMIFFFDSMIEVKFFF